MRKDKSRYGALLVLFLIPSLALSATQQDVRSWKGQYDVWNKVDADKLLQEQYTKYDFTKNLSLGSDITNAVGKANDLLDLADSFGLDSMTGGAISQGKSMLSMVNNETYQRLLIDTGLQILGGADNALLGICYEGGIGGFSGIEMPSIKINPCIKFGIGFDGYDVCGSLPEIPGYKKKSTKILEMDQRNVSLFCNGWSDMVQIETTTLDSKVLQNDPSKALIESKKLQENTNVIEKVKRTKIADVGKMADFKYEGTKLDNDGVVIKDEFGQPKIFKQQPLKGVETQDTQDKRDAFKYVKKIIEKEAAEGNSAEDVEKARNITVANIKQANVAYENEHQYELARNETVDAWHFIEKDVFDTSDIVLLFRTQVIEHENNIEDAAKRVSTIKSEKDNVMLQYKEKVEKWLKNKEAYYYEFEKKGIAAPTSYYVDAITKNLSEEEKYIKRAALLTQIEREMIFDAQYISKLRNKAQSLINELNRRLEIEIVANRMFDMKSAMESVGL